jgi:hypothetical protein
MHEKIKSWYSWRDVTRRTEIVYNLVTDKNLIEYSSNNLSSKVKRSINYN